jgi:putative oxidoreductase
MGMDKFSARYGSYFYFVFRILVGLLFLQHGAQKLIGAFGGVDGAGASVQIFSMFGAAGVIELFGGLFIVLGLFTRVASLISALEIGVAYFMVHFGQGFAPIANGGELALLYFASFLVLLAYGAGKWGIDNTLFRKRKK